MDLICSVVTGTSDAFLEVILEDSPMSLSLLCFTSILYAASIKKKSKPECADIYSGACFEAGKQT